MSQSAWRKNLFEGFLTGLETGRLHSIALRYTQQLMQGERMSAQQAGENLRTKLWKTRGSRFAASGRLRLVNVLSVTTISMLSFYVIVSSIVLVAFSGQLMPINEKWLNIINICISVFVIALSLIEFSRDYLGWSESMNQSALKIGAIYNALSIRVDSGVVNQQDLEAAEREYSRVLLEHQSNHQPIDFYVFKLGAFKEFDDWWLRHPSLRLLAKGWFNVQAIWLYIIGILVCPALATIWGASLLTLRAASG
jgi:SMODS and SLOG-associating 2TM effector domain family 5